MSWWQAILLAVVEGLTEFLPISSTGHLILVAHFMAIANDDFVKLFNVNIQFGAILSVVVLYYRRFFCSIRFYLKLLLGMLPAVVVGLLAGSYIDELLESAWVVSIMLIVGGWVLTRIDGWLPSATPKEDHKQVGYVDAFWVGCFQCLAMVPGVSRSAATIIGGMVRGLGRVGASEFSFFLAVPTMLAASVYKFAKDFLQQGSFTLSAGQWQLLLLGNVVAFVVAMLAMRFFIAYVGKHGFKAFGYYRIVLGLLMLVLLWLDKEVQVL